MLNKALKKCIARTAVIRVKMAILFDIIYSNNNRRCANAKNEKKVKKNRSTAKRVGNRLQQ